MSDGTFVLDRRTLLHHRAGQVIALSSDAIGRTFARVDGAKETRLIAMSERLRDDRIPKIEGSQIAVVEIFGPLAQRADTLCGWIDGYDEILSRTTAALEDTTVAAVMLRIDSPGGDVAGLEECIRQIVEARDASGKPIGVYVDELAASAAYWLAAGVANAGIYAPASAEIGSIGAYTMLLDETGALEQEGRKVTLVRDPPGKDAGNPLAPVTDTALARETARVRLASSRFFEAVSYARGIDVEAVRRMDGATFDAARAVELGLIDEVLSESGALNVVGNVVTVRARDARGDRRAIMARSRKVRAADPPADATSDGGGRASAAQVAQAAADCAVACTEAATACESGTPDEAIAAVGGMIAAAEKAIDTAKSFLGEGGSMPAPEPAEEPMPDAPAADEHARVIRLLESIESERAQERAASVAAAEAEERKRLIAERRVSNHEVRAWLEDPKTPLQSVRDACRVLPPVDAPDLAADLSVVGTRGAGQGGVAGLTAHELKICKDTGCAPERFAELKARRDAAKAGS